MRLLNARTIIVEDFSAKQVPPYAILSHTWEDGEVTLQDMERQTASAKAGYAKIRDSCEQTLRDKLEYIWVDTCCIDKTSSAELSEAINAMFRWYQDSTMCYAFLSDVPSDTNFDESSPFATSRWFTRGWTLQELLAPAKLDFYSNSWDHLGSKADLAKGISSIARIDEAFLRGRPIREASIAARMSWAARRETSREEDLSYSLLGLFDVRIPLLYGEGGKNAFFRLQEELIRKSDDQSIFAWYSFDETSGPVSWNKQMNKQMNNRNSSALADSPAQFRNCGNIVTCNPVKGVLPYVLSNVGIQMKLPIIFLYEGKHLIRRAYAVLWCRPANDYWNIFTVPVLIEGDRCGRAFPAVQLVNRKQAISRSFYHKLYIETRQGHQAMVRSSYLQGRKASVFILRSLPPGYRVESVSPPKLWEPWSSTSGRMTQWANAPKELIPIIKITADGSISVPIRTLRIAVRTAEHNDAHIVTAFGSSMPLSLNSWCVSEKATEWHFIPLNHQTGKHYRPCGVSIRLRKDRHFRHNIDTMDLRTSAYPSFWEKLVTHWQDLSISNSFVGLALLFALSIWPSLRTLIFCFNIKWKANETTWLENQHPISTDAHTTLAYLSCISASAVFMFIVTVASLAAHESVRFPVVPSIRLSSTYIFFMRIGLLLAPTLNIVTGVFEMFYEVLWGGAIIDLRIKIFYSLFWSLMTFKLDWHSWQHLAQRWCFPLFRILISLESAMDFIRRSTTDGRIMDPTLSYDLWRTHKSRETSLN